MWRDFDSFVTGCGGGGTLAFSFPRHAPPDWRQLWRQIVDDVDITATPNDRDRLLDDFAYGHGVRTLGFVNAHALNSCVDDPHFARDLGGLDNLVRDGIGVHALYRLIGSHSGLNLNGTDLLPDLIARFAGQRIALFGTRLHVVDTVAGMLRRDLGCEVVTADGFQPDGYYLERVARSRPALVVLGMGMPKQERVAQQMKHGLHQDVAIVCGGAILDFLSGYKPRAPMWMRRSGLEWAYRLSLEPKRLFGRYIVGNPLFLLRSMLLAGRSQQAQPRPPAAPEARPEPKPFGIGGPVAMMATAGREPAITGSPPPLPPPEPPVTPSAGYRPVASLASIAPQAGVSVFSANRPVVARDDLFGRQHDLDRLLSWVLDQSGNALIYGPRGYGKTSLVRVFGEIADSHGHVVLYASCSRGISFDTLMRQYLSELPAARNTVPLPDGPLSVQQVAARLAGIAGTSLVFIVDEFDRIERTDTREAIVELIKDVSDLTAGVRFVLVGVATDVGAILGYHPSIQRCLTAVPLTRLNPCAIEDLFTRKAAADGLSVGPAEVQTVVRLTAGSAYHAQLIGQKLVSVARRCAFRKVTPAELDRVIDEILADAAMMDDSFARLARAMRDPATRDLLVGLARQALADPGDVVHAAGDVVHAAGDAGPAQRLAALVADGILMPAAPGSESFRFANAFLPQLLLMIDHRAAAHLPATR